MPIILYNSEIWAPFLDYDYSKWNVGQIERVCMQYLKRILGLNRSATNELV